MKHQSQDRLPWADASSGVLATAGLEQGDEVAVLLALHNGARYIEAQLNSLATQTHHHWHLIVSDDGSTDDGPDRVAAWGRKHPDRPIEVISGPGKGFAQNFLHMLRSLQPAPPYTAFCDQDDVWLPEKLERAVAALSRLPRGQPALYSGQRLICDAQLGSLRLTERWNRAPGFANALVQNVMPGNTMVMNRAALRLLQAAARRLDHLYAHDWWAYLMISGAGGRVIRDPVPGLLYRQHGGNAIGARHGPLASFDMLRFGLQGELRQLQNSNLHALKLASAYLTPQNRELLMRFDQTRHLPWHRRPAHLRRLGIYRQTAAGTFGLWLAAALGLL